ncbi:MAG: SH3 domain-containing protein [Hyphomicrobium sp.]
MHRYVFGLSLVAAAHDAGAAPRALTGQELTEKVPGAQISIDTPIGSKIPMRFGRDGLVTGEAGVLGVYLGAAKDRGRWWVAEDRLCIKWFRWFDAVPRCLDLKLEGNRIFWRKDDGESGTGTLTESPRVTAPATAPGSYPAAAPTPKKASPSAAVTADPTPAPQVSAPAEREADQPEEVTAQAPAVAVPSAEPPPARVAAGPAGPPPAETAEIAPTTAASDSAPEPHADRPRPAPPAVQAMPAPQSAPTRTTETPKRPSPRAATARPLPDPGPSFRVARVDDDDMLNVRSGPSDRRPVIGIIPPRGRGVRIVGLCRGEWCPVRHGGVSGWVNRYYLAEDAPGSQARD